MQKGIVPKKRLEGAYLMYAWAHIIVLYLLLGSLAYLVVHYSYYKSRAMQWEAFEIKRLASLESICQIFPSCSSWGDCVDNIQERKCRNRCTGALKRETRACTPAPEAPAAQSQGAIVVNVPVYEDAYVVKLDEKGNYGGKDKLQVSLKSNDVYTSYLKFDTSKVPSDAKVNSLTLWLKVLRGYWKGVNVGAYYCSNNSWKEMNVSTKEQPVCFDNESYYLLDSQNITNETVYLWDVTKALTIAQKEKSLLTFYLKEKSNVYQPHLDYVAFYSKEASENLPTLIVNYTRAS